MSAVHPGRRYIEMLSEEWASIEALCTSFGAPEWDRPTDLPGWNVKDVLSHIVGTESILLGRSAPHTIDMPQHVHNPLGEINEVEVDYRRPRAGIDVFDEYARVTKERVEVLRAMSDDELDQQTWTPIGIDTYAVLLRIRILDCWVHEQDIRRAVDKPGHLAGDIPLHAFRAMCTGIPKAVAKQAGAPDGSTVAFDFSDVDGGSFAIGVEERRGRLLQSAPEEPDSRLTMDLETFMCLTCGRWDPRKALNSARVRLEGDRVLGTRVAANLTGMF